MYEDLTMKQKCVLNFLKETVLQRGYPPSVREIGEAVDLKSTSTVHSHLTNLEKKGYIKRDPSKPRAIEIMDYQYQDQNISKRMINVPLVGKVTAGEPILATENIEDVFPLPIDFLETSEDIFMLKIEGLSMVEAGILNNDQVVVKKQSTAENGDIVVALLEDEATVKRFFKEKKGFRLQPENDHMEPLYVSEVFILGKVIGLIRRF
ncbi:transcriptional repressor LexA [Tindallia californiensis]|uniref:LexA repressor n=2 Tax=Tindallia californiensis TaxID=159292 RepID=A0A1H3NLK5_9FIRM|nr:transcriptional repressor LexA [Tindallia californiensis]SDY89633.1 SOS-response transcriptional repressor, LexA [Tindallia californiensis]